MTADPPPAPSPRSLPAHEELVRAALALLRSDRPAFLGLAGAPGAGKTTVAEELAGALSATGTSVAVVPLDGFHLADAQLDRLGLRQHKGAPDTFDVDGYVALLDRLSVPSARPVYLPGFERDLEQPLAAARVVVPGTRLVLTEGNYLLLREDGWERVRRRLDAVWFVDVDERTRTERLVQRHVQFGKTLQEARAWVARVDQPNAVRVSASRSWADREVAG